MTVSETTFIKLALEDPEGHWELVCGRPRQKPDMTVDHNFAMRELTFQLSTQVDRTRYTVASNAGHVRRSSESYYIPDLFVIPRELERAQLGQRTLEAYAAPLPLVVEIWSPSTGDYDVESKLPEYKKRGDAEIWLVHPYERTVMSWVRQPDGTYAETLYTEGSVRPAALPGVVIELATLFG